MFLQNLSSRYVKDEHVRTQEDKQEATSTAQSGEGKEPSDKRWIPYMEENIRGTLGLVV